MMSVIFVAPFPKLGDSLKPSTVYDVNEMSEKRNGF